MNPVTIVQGVAAPLPTANIDTDQILPKQFLKTITRSGLSAGLFYDQRHDQNGVPTRAFVLDREPYDRAEILVAGDNFGCGSSREHAPWALLDFGIRAIVSTSFADIFYSNCINNGLVPAIVERGALDAIIAEAEQGAGTTIVDLATRTVRMPSGAVHPFAMTETVRERLVAGHDSIAELIDNAPRIAALESALDRTMPWLPRG